MFCIPYNVGMDIIGVYFIQLTGNEKAINLFEKINGGSVKFYKKKYSLEEIMELAKFKDMLLALRSADNDERLVLKGEFKIEGEFRKYAKEELYEWWKKYFENPKFPLWKNVIDEVIDLMADGKN